MDIKIHLDQIEARLRRVIETWINPFNRGDFQYRLAHLVVEAMRGEMVITDDGNPIAPHQFTIRLNPILIHELQGSTVLESLPRALRQAALEVGVGFLYTPELRLEPDDRFNVDDIEVHARVGHLSRGNTAILSLEQPNLRPEERKADGSSFLILNGNQTYPLRQSTINIGRKPDNHLIIDDPRISRVHAQIRLSRGQFIIFDLNSTGGTVVNGMRIRQHALKPGDVISLAGVPLIYGEEYPDDNGDDTQAMANPPPPEELR